ncbi:hypothetical protein MRQ47_004440 [Salmonella enterica]|nr:hypothetical protein [Salmonella enterica]
MKAKSVYNALHSVLNKGHLYAVRHKLTHELYDTARRAETLKPIVHFRSDLEIIDVKAELEPMLPTALA